MLTFCRNKASKVPWIHSNKCSLPLEKVTCLLQSQAKKFLDPEDISVQETWFLKFMWKSLIPHIDYCSQLWFPSKIWIWRKLKTAWSHRTRLKKSITNMNILAGGQSSSTSFLGSRKSFFISWCRTLTILNLFASASCLNSLSIAVELHLGTLGC